MTDVNSIIFEIKRDDFKIYNEEYQPHKNDEEDEKQLQPIESSDDDAAAAKKYKQVAEIYYGETDENRAERIQQFRDKLESSWPQMLNNLPGNNPDEFLLKILRAGSFDVEGALKALHNYVDLIRSGPRYFANAFEDDDKREVSTKAFESRIGTMLPQRDKFGRRVFIFRIGHWNPDTLPFHDFFCSSFMLVEMAAMEQETQVAGITAICDGANFGFKQFRNISFENVKYTARVLQDLPVIFRSLHIVNCSTLLMTIIRMIRPLLHERLRDAIVIHGSLDELHQFVDKDILPSNLDGEAGKFDNAESARAAASMPQYFSQLKKYIYQD